jgi:hypothetical protein
MKKFIASSAIATLASASNLWYDYDYASNQIGGYPMTIGNFMWMNYGWEFELEYYTFYRAGEGPYYGEDNSGTPIYSTLDSDHHYEEYGFSVDNWGDIYIDIGLGDESGNSPWAMRIEGNLDTFKIRPYR